MALSNWEITLQSVIKLVIITTVPTLINIVFKGSLPTSLAAIGAAIKPPTIRPATSANGRLFKRIKKVIELAKKDVKIAKWLDEVEIKKEIYVEAKLVNFVI